VAVVLKEMPCWPEAPIMMHCTKGGITGLSAFQRTIKQGEPSLVLISLF
jgi:hypothetical protein